VERIVAGRQLPQLIALAFPTGRLDISMGWAAQSELSDLRSRSEHAPINSGTATTLLLFKAKRQVWS
jgi:hypothetical protein